eukprot:4310134-Pleurochrysis_carterae.AAC.4
MLYVPPVVTNVETMINIGLRAISRCCTGNYVYSGFSPLLVRTAIPLSLSPATEGTIRCFGVMTLILRITLDIGLLAQKQNNSLLGSVSAANTNLGPVPMCSCSHHALAVLALIANLALRQAVSDIHKLVGSCYVVSQPAGTNLPVYATDPT